MSSTRSTRIWIPLLAATIAGCAPSPTEPSHYAPFSQTDLQTGTGAAAAAGNRLTTHYTLWLFDDEAADNKGVLIESSEGLEPLEFVLGVGAVIEGWDQGLVGMQTGGVRRLIVPPSLGYGRARNGVIPPSATLLFEIELMEVDDTP
jgi:FKBP-type peptidyl-prolyl cis-trans isomerase FkpA